MTIEAKMTVAERIDQLMQHLGIDKAHFAGRVAADWTGSATSYPDRILSMTIVGLSGFDNDAMTNLAPRMLIISGDRGMFTNAVQRVTGIVPATNLITIPNYEMLGWTDVIVDHTEEIGRTFLNFLAKHNSVEIEPVGQQVHLEGEIAGIWYQIRGSGPPLVLLPLGLAPSQWEPLIPTLSEQYCTVTLGGAHLGVIPAMELRGETAGYRRIIKNLMSEAQLQPGDSILDVGPGSGVVDRWLAHATNRENQITGIELNPCLLREATQFAKKEGLAETISFREGNATSLPFPDDTFDLSFSSTVMEEVDADRMLAEMVRVTKPSGKVASIVRAIDLPFIINLALRPELMEKVINMHMSMSEKGCADASLYRRFHQAGLTEVKNFPQMATFDQENSTMLTWLQNAHFFTELNPEEQVEWRDARTQAEIEATFFISWPHHCAVGSKAD